MKERIKCLYSKCDNEFVPKNTKTKFCCASHRVMWHRENGKIDEIVDENKNGILNERNPPKVKTTETETIPPMPTRNEGEDALDFAQRKNEWKLKYNQ